MKNVTNVLSNEHQTILRAIDAVIIACEKSEKSNELDKPYFEHVIYFIKNYADKFHHAKEEDILFRTMLEGQGGMHCNPIPVMLSEHDEGRRYVAGMEEGLSQNDKARILENVRGYCYLLQNHIYKEDNILYPMAESALDDTQKEEILKQYKEVEAKSFTVDELKEMLSKISSF
ncbi:MAG: hemerythrin domain-containing protein [Bacteroidales bacterium]|nr:hemerythrin domain-containing protein [Bacteroidales bacterium]MCF8455909.1 hemerythrin domain-containing protein [Bacteroidales bacterium]